MNLDQTVAGKRTQLGQILLTVAGLDSTKLEGFLGNLAAGDPRLAREVRHRLSSTGTFLAVPAAERLLRDGGDPTLDESPSAPRPATPEPVSDRYSLGECLGEGGMARVFRAFDHKLSRSVALKFLTRDAPAVADRFLREARAQARVSHDNVLEVYDAGELEGKPYIAMRWVRGPTLLQLPPGLSLEQRVDLAIQTAEGLHAAHRKGLIHRDVKPSNVLVEEMEDGELRAFVSDFGIAMEISDGAQGVLSGGTLAGTPAFMAPELLGILSGSSEAAVDRRVDVYSLGVTLYELFTGQRPFEHPETIELLRQAAREEPLPARQVAPGIPADLEAVIMRCLARDPDDRYPSARAVAEDLRRFLAGDVVEAFSATWAYRMTRFALRHRKLLATVVVAIALLLAASVIIAAFAVEAERERERAQQRRAQAEELIGFMLGDLREKLASAERLAILDDVGAAALEYFAAVPAQELTDEELAERSRLLYQIGEVRIQKGDLEGSLPALEESLILARRLAQLHPEDGQHLFDLGQSQFWLGYIHWRRGDPAEARPYFEEYLATARRLTDMDPTNLDWQLELSYAHSNLGSVLQDLGDLESALAEFEQTLAIDRRLVTRQPDNLDWRHSLGSTHSTLGVVLRSLGRPLPARTHLEANLALKRELAASEPTSLRRREALGTSLEALGALLFDTGDLAGAGPLFAESHDLFADLTQRDRQNSQWWYKLAWSHIRLGLTARAGGDLSTALNEHRTAQDILESQERRDVSDPFWLRSVAVNMQHLAAVRRAAGEPTEALALTRDSVRMLEARLAEQPEDRRAVRWLGAGHLLLGNLTQEAGDAAAARDAWQASAQTLEPLVSGSRDGRWLAPWAEALVRLGRADEAGAALEALRAQSFYAPELAAQCRLHGAP